VDPRSQRLKRLPAVRLKSMIATHAIQTILRHKLDHRTEWEDAARSPEDIEGAHQTRAAFRRMHSAMTIFRHAIPESVTVAWAQQMGELAGKLGKARDLDVFIDEAFGSAPGKLSASPGLSVAPDRPAGADDALASDRDRRRRLVTDPAGSRLR